MTKNHYNQSNSKEFFDGENNEITNQSIYHSDRPYYEYLYGMKTEDEIDDCDYSAAFMFV